ncbi:hypothetical protein B0H10DRAFT_2210959 [Mycena sp. CBHHK59/15]|nr:hypothetical protein B0H10DRAFT_2210959 [Mycena sp. CBHHK59/15]
MGAGQLVPAAPRLCLHARCPYTKQDQPRHPHENREPDHALGLLQSTAMMTSVALNGARASPCSLIRSPRARNTHVLHALASSSGVTSLLTLSPDLNSTSGNVPAATSDSMTGKNGPGQMAPDFPPPPWRWAEKHSARMRKAAEVDHERVEWDGRAVRSYRAAAVRSPHVSASGTFDVLAPNSLTTYGRSPSPTARRRLPSSALTDDDADGPGTAGKCRSWIRRALRGKEVPGSEPRACLPFLAVILSAQFPLAHFPPPCAPPPPFAAQTAIRAVGVKTGKRAARCGGEVPPNPLFGTQRRSFDAPATFRTAISPTAQARRRARA